MVLQCHFATIHAQRRGGFADGEEGAIKDALGVRGEIGRGMLAVIPWASRWEAGHQSRPMFREQTYKGITRNAPGA